MDNAGDTRLEEIKAEASGPPCDCVWRCYFWFLERWRVVEQVLEMHQMVTTRMGNTSEEGRVAWGMRV